MKKAFHCFQASAGLYQFINDNFLHAPSPDLNREVVKLLSNLMLAQAQECFVQKSIQEKKKNSLISKLASDCAYRYGTLTENLMDGLAKTLFSKMYYSLCVIKSKYYDALAQYHRGLSLEADTKYGEAVARFTNAESIAKEAWKQASTFNRIQSATEISYFSPDCGNQLETILHTLHQVTLEKMNSSVKENDLIYHEIVPKIDVLAPIEKLGAAKAIPLNELYPQADAAKLVGPDIFARLVPMSVHESESLYSEEKAKLVRQESERVEEADVELDSAFSYMELPHSLEKFKSFSDSNVNDVQKLVTPPPEVKNLAGAIYISDSEQPLNQLIHKIKTSSLELSKTLDNCSDSLLDESHQCEKLRNQYQDLWTQSPSSASASPLRQEISNHRSVLSQASQTDANILRQYQYHERYLSILSQGPDSDQLETLFAEMAAATTGSNPSHTANIMDDQPSNIPISSLVELVRESMYKLNQLKKERNELLSNLKKQTREDDISHILVLNQKSNVENQVFASELEKFRPLQNKITTTVHHQQAMLQELTGHYKQLMASDEARKIQTKWDSVQKARESLVVALTKAASTYEEIRSSANQASDFYDQLSSKIQKLNINVTQFVEERTRERNRILENIKKENQVNNHAALSSMIASQPASTPTNIYTSNPPPQQSLSDQFQRMSIGSPYAQDTRAASHAAQSAPPMPSAPPAHHVPSAPYAPQSYDPFDAAQLQQHSTQHSSQTTSYPGYHPAPIPQPSQSPYPQHSPYQPHYQYQAPPPSHPQSHPPPPHQQFYQHPPPPAGRQPYQPYQQPQQPHDPYSAYSQRPPPPPPPHGQYRPPY